METAVPAPAVKPRSTGRYVAASLAGLLALLLGAAGVAGLWARYGASDHGWITSGSHRYAASGRAIVSGSLDADGIPNWLVAQARITASSGNGHALFVGVARRADVDRYLAGVAHSTVEDVNFGPFDATYSSTTGSVVPGRPAAQAFWAKFGTQAATWKIRNGHWRVVVMNADASPGVVANAKVGVTIRGALPIAFALLGVAIALAAGAVALAVGRPQGVTPFE
jgi:hypothetical protein